MGIDEKIKQLQQELHRVRTCSSARLPSWVAAAAVAAGLTVAGGACTTERHVEKPADDPADNPAQMGAMDVDPGPVAVYAGPPQPRDMEVPENVPAYEGPPEGDIYGGPPMAEPLDMSGPEVHP